MIEGGSIDPLGAGQRLSLVAFRVAVHPHSYTDRRPFGPALERLLATWISLAAGVAAAKGGSGEAVGSAGELLI